MCEHSYVLTVIPDKTRATATRFHGRAVTIYVMAGKQVTIVEEFRELRNPEKVEI